MSNVFSVRTASNSNASTMRPNAVHKLVAQLRETYGMSETDVSALDEQGLIRVVATLEFLANNLPPGTRAGTWCKV